jgi:mannose-6-phosphate isomerase-like protein (cupin superfamily)
MTAKRMIAVAGAALALTAGVGYAAHRATITAVSPATVPSGFLVANSYLPVKLAVQVNRAKEHIYNGGVQVYVQHATVAPGASTGWHSHAGPVLVMIVNGALTLYSGDDKTCTGRKYPAGQGFVDQGFGHIHIARNEGTVPAEFYAVYLLPNGSGDAGIKQVQTGFSNPACSFAS